MTDPRIEANRQNWNERTPIHAASGFYNVQAFKEGKCTLNEIERSEVGDVSGKSLLHLQCHFGMDTMSWARLGAKATGVDISDEAISLARSLNNELGLDARFIRSNIYDLPNLLNEKFDIVYTASGVLCWLPDIEGWAKVVANHVKPGGMFYILDGHPFAGAVEPKESGDGAHDLVLHNSYFPHPEGFRYDGGHTYTGADQISTSSYEWQHSISEIVNSIIDAGLQIEFFNEFSKGNWRMFPHMVKSDDGWWRLPERNESLPQLFSLRAVKPTS